MNTTRLDGVKRVRDWKINVWVCLGAGYRVLLVGSVRVCIVASGSLERVLAPQNELQRETFFAPKQSTQFYAESSTKLFILAGGSRFDSFCTKTVYAILCRISHQIMHFGRGGLDLLVFVPKRSTQFHVESRTKFKSWKRLASYRHTSDSLE